MRTALNVTFGGTILYDPIKTFIYCILGSKITNLEQGLTWISQNAQITLLTLPNNILLLSNSSMNEIVSPITAAAIGSGSGSNSSNDGIVGSLIDHFESALRAERNFYAILLGVWLGFALIGLIVVIWHSGGSDKYIAWRNKRNPQGEIVKAKLWPKKQDHPLYDEYAEKQFRGTSPAVPRIVEPDFAQKTGNEHSFVDAVTVRTSVPRKGTFGSTMSSLAAPGQAFLRMAGRANSEDGRTKLVEKGRSSEKYNYDVPIEALETPPPFWVNKFFSAVGSARDLLPTRGQRHGAALARNGSSKTERSFGASAGMPGSDWRGSSGSGRGKEPAWTMIDPQSIGRALDGPSDDSRYPPLARSTSSTATTAHPIYPRPMSRAPTLREGNTVPTRPIQRSMEAPPCPDSIDCLQDESNHDQRYEDVH